MSDVVVALVQARLGSSRLPGKVMLRLGEPRPRAMVSHVVSRVLAAPGVDRVVLCVPADEPQWPHLMLPDGVDLLRYAGPTDDVLGRFAAAAERFPATHYVRVTADCPLLDPWVVGLTIQRHRLEAARGLRAVHAIGLTTTSPHSATGWPDGQDVEVFSAAMLRAAQEHAGPEDREHVTTWLRRERRVCYLPLARHAPAAWLDGLPMMWSVDTAAHLAFAQRVYAALGDGLWGLPAVVRYLRTTGDKP